MVAETGGRAEKEKGARRRAFPRPSRPAPQLPRPPPPKRAGRCRRRDARAHVCVNVRARTRPLQLSYHSPAPLPYQWPLCGCRRPERRHEVQGEGWEAASRTPGRAHRTPTAAVGARAPRKPGEARFPEGLHALELEKGAERAVARASPLRAVGQSLYPQAWEDGDALSPGPRPARWRWAVVLLQPAGSPDSSLEVTSAPGGGPRWQVPRQGLARWRREKGAASLLPLGTSVGFLLRSVQLRDLLNLEGLHPQSIRNSQSQTDKKRYSQEKLLQRPNEKYSQCSEFRNKHGIRHHRPLGWLVLTILL